jgi:hypothetical protein
MILMQIRVFDEGLRFEKGKESTQEPGFAL